VFHPAIGKKSEETQSLVGEEEKAVKQKHSLGFYGTFVCKLGVLIYRKAFNAIQSAMQRRLLLCWIYIHVLFGRRGEGRL